jgi:hypothetical protein
MRLLDTSTHELKTFNGDIPPYAILSHRWRENEVTFQDLQSRNASHYAGYDKIERTCSIAAAAGLKYAWIDTCCINKMDSAELSEAINSMYRWYEEATLCYAYLADVPSHWSLAVFITRGYITPRGRDRPRDPFFHSEWFTRGWTLQELLAPSIVIFLNNKWGEIGTKKSLSETVAEITGIPRSILLGAEIGSASVAQRMSWAAGRNTTRVEDLAYCLMGLFDVNMPLLYGEGENAFFRLQEEILKIWNDYTIFVAGLEEEYTFKKAKVAQDKFLATSPAGFRVVGMSCHHLHRAQNTGLLQSIAKGSI